MYIYVYVYIHMYTCVCVYAYIKNNNVKLSFQCYFPCGIDLHIPVRIAMPVSL